MPKLYKLIVNVPLSHADAVRDAIGDAGGGKAGHYSHCSFSMRGMGRFKGDSKSHPHIGEPGEYEQVQEERIEVSHIPANILRNVVKAMEKAHPYEETAYQILEMVNLDAIDP